jgi:hypothetical protein
MTMNVWKEVVMKSRLRFWVLVPFVVISMFALNGCAKNKATPSEDISKYTTDMREAVSVKINDTDRREELLQLIMEMEAVMQDFNKDIHAFVDQYRVLDKDYNTPRQSFENLIVEFSSQRKQAQAEIFDLHFKAVALMTKEEWDQVVKYEKKAIGAMIEARDPQEDTGQ